MIYAVLFEDNEEFTDQRTKYMGQHLEFLKSHSNSIFSAGPLFDAESDQGAGGLWLVESQEIESVKASLSSHKALVEPFPWNLPFLISLCMYIRSTKR